MTFQLIILWVGEIKSRFMKANNWQLLMQKLFGGQIVILREFITMKYSNNRTNIISFTFACIILLSSVFAISARNLNNRINLSLNEKGLKKEESASKMKEINSSKENKKREESRSSAELSYNFVYFLVSKVMQITTISRPK